jgi:hypothetical protein
MLFRSPELKRNLYAKVVRSETIDEYMSGIKYLLDQGWQFSVIISDGIGLKTDFFGIPFQMCQFHQTKIITGYLTKNPILEANIELRRLTFRLSGTDRDSFTGWLADWYEKWKDFLREKTIDECTGKWVYTHRRTRSAYYSLKRNLPYLYTFQDYLKAGVPNTNNCIEGAFSSIKKKVNIHNGLRRDRKIKLTFYLVYRG